MHDTFARILMAREPRRRRRRRPTDKRGQKFLHNLSDQTEGHVRSRCISGAAYYYYYRHD